MMTKNLENNLMEFYSPLRSETFNENETDLPGSNPFDTLLQSAETFHNNGINREFFDIDCGRESLGILHADLQKCQFDDENWSNIPDIQINQTNSPNSQKCVSSVLNTAFLYSYNKSSKLSIASTNPSSLSSYPDSLEFWELSSIPANSLINNCTSSFILNKAFITSNSGNQITPLIPKESDCIIKDVQQLRPRLHSLPNIDMNIGKHVFQQKDANLCLKNFCKSEILFRESSMTPQLFKQEDLQHEEFSDSVFIEGQHIASKLADESIYNSAEGELYSLDCTPQPDLVDDSGEENVAATFSSQILTEEIFKAVNKMIPSGNVISNSPNNAELDPKPAETAEGEIMQISKYRNSSISDSSLSHNECHQNVSDMPAEDGNKLSNSRLSHCSSNSKSRDAKSILHNLSEILSTDNLSAQQKSEGQNLLFNLADILCSNNTRSLNHNKSQSEDSGHSSIDQEILPTNEDESTSYNALDLRMNVHTPKRNTRELMQEQDKPLDLSISKRKYPDRLYNVPVTSASYKQSVSKSTLRTTCSNNSIHTDNSKNESVNSNDSKNASNVKVNISELSTLGKLKPKKVDKKIVPEKGPLKAVIPVGNMSKLKAVSRYSKIGVTPPKGNQYNSIPKSKRTSTPKTEPKLQPMAQSTPEGSSDTRTFIPSTTRLLQRRSDGHISPLSRMNYTGNGSTEELNTKTRSGSTPNLSASSKAKNTSSLNSSHMFRRRSATDLKASKDGKVLGNKEQLKRSNTLEKDSGITKTLNRVRENIEKSRNTSLPGIKTAANTKVAQSKVVLGERNRVSNNSSGIKPCNLVSKMKRSTGKENLVN